MATFTLQLLISKVDLGTISAAGENIVVARGFSDSASNLAWASLSPLENNGISWDDAVGLFAATTVSSGHVQPQSTISPVSSGMYYTFGPQPPVFAGPYGGTGAPPIGSYRVFNKIAPSIQPSMVFGLTLGVTANGTANPSNPATMQIVPANQYATFTPIGTVYVWLQSGVVSGDVVAVPPQPGDSLATPRRSMVATSFSTKIQFAVPSTLSCTYNSSLGAFVQSA